ncbi:hypothetical protein [Thiomicrorhabdus lithotrophica]|uniref:Uncharacterized protein n=1 Tax=Thiomicrorhabdus lithotrophica TaxID=2949997 RepID=A0ABY8CBH5_9GAMM|nr:hypothetical protein [Thiomicrorhabdus lithotrophica]WEJ62167.1 hypothetical protein NR989_09115 [Thiomicrorhabdus lithotrophica]
MEIELKCEHWLNMLRVSSVGGDGSASSTVRDKMRPGDVAAALGMVEDNRHRLALEVRAGLGDEKEIMLLLQTIRQNLVVFDWFCKESMQKSSYRLKLDRVSRCAISQLVLGVEMAKAAKACEVGIARQSYYKTWDVRERNIFQLIYQWSIDGDRALYSRLSDRFEAA